MKGISQYFRQRFNSCQWQVMEVSETLVIHQLAVTKMTFSFFWFQISCLVLWGVGRISNDHQTSFCTIGIIAKCLVIVRDQQLRRRILKVFHQREVQESDFLKSDQGNGWRPAFKERIPCHLQRGVSSSWSAANCIIFIKQVQCVKYWIEGTFYGPKNSKKGTEYVPWKSSKR